MDYKVPPTVSTAEFFASDRGYAFLVSETAVAAFVLDEWSFTILHLLRDHPAGTSRSRIRALRLNYPYWRFDRIFSGRSCWGATY